MEGLQYTMGEVDVSAATQFYTTGIYTTNQSADWHGLGIRLRDYNGNAKQS